MGPGALITQSSPTMAVSYKALDEDKRKLVASLVQAIDAAVTGVATGRLRRRGVRLRVRAPKPPTKLAKYCQRPNRRVCEEALRWVGLFFSPSGIEEAVRWGLASNVPAEVVIAYLYAFTMTLLGGELGQGVTASVSKVRVDMEHFALDLTPVGSEFTITDARNVLPSLRLRGF